MIERGSRSPLRAVTRLVGVLPLALALLAEGAWVAVVAALVQAAAGQTITLGLLPLAAAALAGLAAARLGTARLGSRWPILAGAVVLAAGAVGWLAGDRVIEIVASGDVRTALATNPGGWAVGLAFLRGLAHAERRVPGEHDQPSGSLLAVGVVVIVVAFLLGGTLPEAGQAAFRAAAVPDTIAFVAAGLVARSLARIAAIGGGFDWRRNPAWIALLATLVVAILLVAVPGSFAIGPLVVLIVAALPVPLLLVGLVSGMDRRALRFILGFSALAALVLIVLRVFSTPGGGPGELGGIGVTPTTPDEPAWVTVAAWITGLLAVVGAIGLLAALWMVSARRRADDDVAEERVIDHGDEPRGPRRSWFRRPGRGPHGSPTDAAAAYRAAIRDMAKSDRLRRRGGETPAEHAGRVRAEARIGQPSIPSGTATSRGPRGFGPALDLLAADYELARFGGRPLTPTEHRRAVGRWRRIREAVRGEIRAPS